MKIGIVTPFDNRNLGNRLQNYALQQVLRNYADTVITIRNKPALPSLMDRLRRSSPLAESVWVNRLLGEKRKARLLQFNRAYLLMSRKCYWYNRPLTSLAPEDRCDWYCAGSDQVWNPDLGRSGMFSYLGFAPQEQTFSYAASFGLEQIPPEYWRAVEWGLRYIRHLSLREAAGKKIVSDITGRTDAEILPDPTLLLTPEQWDLVAHQPEAQLPKRYLLAYFLGRVSSSRREMLLRLAEEQNLTLIDLMDPNSPFYAAGPGEFLYLIRHAALVCTDSFHGSVFSFLYQRPLLIFDREGEGETMGSRLDTLTETYGLQDCRVRDGCLPPIQVTADYSLGYARLQEERTRARNYLDRILQPEVQQ